MLLYVFQTNRILTDWPITVLLEFLSPCVFHAETVGFPVSTVWRYMLGAMWSWTHWAVGTSITVRLATLPAVVTFALALSLLAQRKINARALGSMRNWRRHDGVSSGRRQEPWAETIFWVSISWRAEPMNQKEGETVKNMIKIEERRPAEPKDYRNRTKRNQSKAR